MRISIAFQSVATAFLAALVLGLAVFTPEAGHQDLTKSRCVSEWCRYEQLHGAKAYEEREVQSIIADQARTLSAGAHCTTSAPPTGTVADFLLVHRIGSAVVVRASVARVWTANTSVSKTDDLWIDRFCFTR